jgi:hypothetical protein
MYRADLTRSPLNMKLDGPSAQMEALEERTSILPTIKRNKTPRRLVNLRYNSLFVITDLLFRRTRTFAYFRSKLYHNILQALRDIKRTLGNL